jgi:hypothetical protein
MMMTGGRCCAVAGPEPGWLDWALADATAPATRSASKIVGMGLMARSFDCCDILEIWRREPI